MPYVQVSPQVSLYYEISHSPSSDPSSSDPDRIRSSDKPWVLVLHPLYQDAYCVKRNIEDPQLAHSFHRISFDLRYHGRSKNPAVAAFDMYTIAADIAIALDILKIPPIHGLALHPWSAEILLRMAVLFPAKVLTMCLCSMSPHTDDEFTKRAFGECFQCWAYPEVPEEWDEAISSTQWWHFGPASHFDADVLDEWAGIMLRRYPPSRAVEQVVVAMPYLKRDVLPAFAHEPLVQPVLFLRGGLDTVYTLADTTDRLNALPPNPSHELRIIPGAPLQFCRTHPTQLRDHYLDWIQPILAEIDPQVNTYRKTDWQAGLDRLARICGDDSISLRDPTLSSSYCGYDPTTIQEIEVLLEQLTVRQQTAFSFVGGGAPEIWTGASFDEVFPWRFSSRFDDARMAGSTSSRNDSLLMREMIEASVDNVTIETKVRTTCGEIDEIDEKETKEEIIVRSHPFI